MTDEQIKQNAEEYANNKLEWSRNRHSESPYLAWKEGFEDGAHSRDEEIEQLGKSYHDMSVELAYKVEQFRKPWISVEDRLPKESEKHNGWLSDTVFVVTSQSDGTSARYDHATKTWCPAEILRGHITHWMPIPELKKN